MKRILPFIIIVIVLGVALVSAWALKKRSTNTVTPVANNLNSTTPADPSAGVIIGVPGSEPAHTLGPATAPARLEEFGDFECPPCGMLHPILKQLQAEFGPTKLRLILREFPLVPNHAHALAAARAAEAAGLQGKFWEMHDIIYEHQKDWHEAFDVRPIFEGYAKTIGLDVAQFAQDNTSEIVEQRIFLDGKRAHSLGVQGTPTVFLNGKEVPFQSLAPDKLKELINNELAAHQ